MGGRGHPAGGGWGWGFGSSLVGGITYLLDDEFRDTLAAGSVHGTAATPGPGTRTVTDANSKLSVGSGVLSIATGGVGANEPLVYYDSLTRTAGRLMVFKSNVATEGFRIGLTEDNTKGRQSVVNTAGTDLRIAGTAGPILVVGAYSVATDYQFAIVLKASGEYVFVKGGAFTNWTLLFPDARGATGTLYPVISADDSTSVFTVDYVRIPDVLWLPTPIAYTAFPLGNQALAGTVTDSTGPDSQAVTARTWESGGATWAIASNEAVNTPTLGAEILDNPGFEGTYDDESGGGGGTINVAPNWDNSNCETDGTDTLDENAVTIHGGSKSQYANVDAQREGVQSDSINITAGTWYQFSVWVYPVSGTVSMWDALNRVSIDKDSSGTGAWEQIVATSRCTSSGGEAMRVRGEGGAAEFYADDASIKPLTLNTLFTDVDDSATSDVVAEVECDTIVAGTQAGMVLNLDDKDSPANFIIAYHDGTNAKLDKCVAGTYTSVISAAATYSAGAKIVVVKDSTSYSLFYNNAKIGSTSTISDAGIISNTKHGLFSSYSGNQLDLFLLMPRGGGSYSQLDKY